MNDTSLRRPHGRVPILLLPLVFTAAPMAAQTPELVYIANVTATSHLGGDALSHS